MKSRERVGGKREWGGLRKRERDRERERGTERVTEIQRERGESWIKSLSGRDKPEQHDQNNPVKHFLVGSEYDDRCNDTGGD